jgi:hypothetical protein
MGITGGYFSRFWILADCGKLFLIPRRPTSGGGGGTPNKLYLLFLYMAF